MKKGCILRANVWIYGLLFRAAVEIAGALNVSEGSTKFGAKFA